VKKGPELDPAPSTKKDPGIMNDNETQFRIGATHASAWFRSVVKQMAKEGKSASEISDRLGDLHQVLLDWRNSLRIQSLDLPGEGHQNPWEWTRDELDTFIERRKSQW
jgi:hypothetical protein